MCCLRRLGGNDVRGRCACAIAARKRCIGPKRAYPGSTRPHGNGCRGAWGEQPVCTFAAALGCGAVVGVDRCQNQTVKNRILPVFGSAQQGLNQKTQRIQGFMMPLDPGEKQRHFLISSVPLTCSFCLPGGPESMVEVTTKTPVRYSMEPVVVEGKFAVLADDPYGMYYRMTDAVAVK